MITAYTHTSFTVSEIERSIRFYTDILGGKLTRRWERSGPEIQQVVGVKGAHLKMALVQIGTLNLELIQYASGGAPAINPTINQPGTAHIGFSVDDVDKFAGQLGSKGVRFYGALASVPPAGSSPGTKPPPGARAVYFADPDGITLEIAQALS